MLQNALPANLVVFLLEHVLSVLSGTAGEGLQGHHSALPRLRLSLLVVQIHQFFKAGVELKAAVKSWTLGIGSLEMVLDSSEERVGRHGWGVAVSSLFLLPDSALEHLFEILLFCLPLKVQILCR